MADGAPFRVDRMMLWYGSKSLCTIKGSRNVPFQRIPTATLR